MAAFSLYSQTWKIQELISQANIENILSILDTGGSRLDLIQDDLFEYYQSGNFISGITSELTASEFTPVSEHFLGTHEYSLKSQIKISFTSEQLEQATFHFPLNFTKVLLHHIVEYCILEYRPKVLKFEFSLGHKTPTMRQCKLRLYIYSALDFSVNDYSNFNREIKSRLNLDPTQTHVGLIKTVL